MVFVQGVWRSRNVSYLPQGETGTPAMVTRYSLENHHGNTCSLCKNSCEEPSKLKSMEKI
eukprot:Awhi_evm1s3013